MRCPVFIRDFLSAYADGELGEAERIAVEDHLSGCARCRGSLLEERHLKQLIRTSAPLARVPADARLRLRAALGADIGADAYRGGLGAQRSLAYRGAAFPAPRAIRVARWLGARPLRAAIPLVAAVALFFVVAIGVKGFGNRVSVTEVPPTPIFDLATASYDGLVRGFTPNVAMESARRGDGSDFAWVIDRNSGRGGDDESTDLARAYRDAGVPEQVYDFSAVGYGLYGGRIDQSVDGWPISYTVYSGEKGEILSICMHASGFSTPVGASYWAGSHTFFSYKGHSLCLTFSSSGHFISILVSHEPVTDLLRNVALADAASASS